MTYRLAIDYGTSYSGAAIADLPSGEPRTVFTNGRPTIPSLVVLDARSGELLTGETAENAAAIRPEMVIRSPKRYLGRREPLFREPRIEPEDAVAATLRALLAEAAALRDRRPPAEVRLTHPARWASARRAALAEAARRAGIENPVLLAEPVAAALRFAAGETIEPGQYVAVYDLGAGTFDTAVLERTADGFGLVGEPGGLELGGESFDERLYQYLGRQLDPADWDALQNSTERVWRNAQADFRRWIRLAKEALSGNPRGVDVRYPGPADHDPLWLTADELNEQLRPDLAKTVDELDRTIAAAGLTPSRLAAVYLAGGSSKIPLVETLIVHRFGMSARLEDDRKQVVALGAAGAPASALPPQLPLPAPAAPAEPPPPPPVVAAPPPAEPEPEPEPERAALTEPEPEPAHPEPEPVHPEPEPEPEPVAAAAAPSGPPPVPPPLQPTAPVVIGPPGAPPELAPVSFAAVPPPGDPTATSEPPPPSASPPSQPPVAWGAPPAGAAPDQPTPFRSAGMRSIIAVGALAVIGFVSAVTLAIDVIGFSVLDRAVAGTITDREAAAYDSQAAVVAIAYLVALVVAGVAFLAWFSRVVANIPALGRGATVATPRAAIGWWFVPFLSYYKPFQIAKDVDERLAEPGERPSNLLNAWWGLWVASLVIGVVSALVFRNALTIDTLRTQVTLATITDILTVVAAGLAIAVVVRVQAREDRAAKAAGLGHTAKPLLDLRAPIVAGVAAAVLAIAAGVFLSPRAGGSDGSASNPTPGPTASRAASPSPTARPTPSPTATTAGPTPFTEPPTTAGAAAEQYLFELIRERGLGVGCDVRALQSDDPPEAIARVGCGASAEWDALVYYLMPSLQALDDHVAQLKEDGAGTATDVCGEEQTWAFVGSEETAHGALLCTEIASDATDQLPHSLIEWTEDDFHTYAWMEKQTDDLAALFAAWGDSGAASALP